ncbi:MAG: NAD-dependent deacylase [Alphaproteobacteria bacterium]|nr:NAD-dependent deacylase [Alphaproteobacteria bacterium]
MPKERISRIVVLTGAGISAESGIPVFRGADGLWQGHRVEDVATAEAVAFNRPVVNDFFNKRRREVEKVAPNSAHRALVEWEQACGDDFLLVTQNIDPLHERAGSHNLIHMHGELQRIRCDSCGESAPFFADALAQTLCPVCGRAGGLRPDVVLFGEMPMRMEEVFMALSACDLFVAIGTSGAVYPAAGFVDLANQAGAYTVEINAAETERSPTFHERLTGRAGEVVPDFVASCFKL